MSQTKQSRSWKRKKKSREGNRW